MLVSVQGAACYGRSNICDKRINNRQHWLLSREVTEGESQQFLFSSCIHLARAMRETEACKVAPINKPADN